MRESKPVWVVEQVIQLKEPKPFVLCRPLTKFPLHFTDIHLGFPRVRSRLFCLGLPTGWRPSPVYVALPRAEYYDASVSALRRWWTAHLCIPVAASHVHGAELYEVV